jgi:hypothetical protein
MLLATFASNFIQMDFTIWGNILGYSLLTNIVFIYVFIVSNRNYCWFTKLSVIALPLMNIICLFGNLVNYETYGFWYEVIICAIVFFLSILLALKKL